MNKRQPLPSMLRSLLRLCLHLPAAMDIVSIMFGEAAAKQLMNIPLSDTNISRRILDLAEDINDRLKDNFFVILNLGAVKML